MNSLLAHDLADNTSLDLAPVVPLDEGTVAPVEQFPDNRGPAPAIEDGQHEGGEPWIESEYKPQAAIDDSNGLPCYSENPLYAPSGPGKILLRNGNWLVIIRSSEADNLEGYWTDGDGFFWLMNGAWEEFSQADGMDIIGPWPGQQFRLLSPREPWIAGDEFYDVAREDWIDCREPFATPSDRRYIRRKLAGVKQ
jgi:hypothetical protein